MTKFTCADGEQRVVGTWYPYPFVPKNTKTRTPALQTAMLPVTCSSPYFNHLWLSDGEAVARYGQEENMKQRLWWCVSYSTPEAPPRRVSTEEMGKPIMDRLYELGVAVERARGMLRYGSPLFYMSAEERRRRMRGYDLIIGGFGISFLDK